MTLGRGLLQWSALLVGLLVMPATAAAQGFEAVGLRALGMGGAFVAVADDASATYWNPAGLVTGPVFSLVAETGRGTHEATPVPTAAGVAPGTLGFLRQRGTLIALGTWPIGGTFYRLPTASARVVGSGAAESTASLGRLTTTHIGVNVLQTVVDGVHVGATLKYVHGSAGQGVGSPAPADPLDAAAALATRGSHAFDLDTGVMIDLVPRLRVGLTVRNLLEPGFEAGEGRQLELPRQVRTGLAFRPTTGLTLSFDADLTSSPDPTGDRRNLAMGAEQRFWQERASVRGGVRVSTDADTRPVVTTGGSVALRSGVFADGYVAVGLEASAPDGFGVGLRVTF
jgi:hypothetical protein